MKTQTLFTAAMATLICFFGASTASAQYPAHACHSDTAHAHTACVATTTPVCDASESCVCDTGFVMNGSLPNGDPNCVRAESFPDVCDPETLGTEPNGHGSCRCTEENRAAGAIGTTPVFISYADRRAHDLPLHGQARGCYILRHGEVAPAPFSDWQQWRDGVDRDIAGLRTALLAICDQPLPEGVTAANLTWVQIQEMCATTRAMIGNANPADPNIAQHLNQIDNNIVQMGDLINALTRRVETLEAHDADHERRITALEHRPGSVADGPNSFALSLGAMGELGFATYGPMTLSGDAMVTGMFRPGDARLDFYLRLRGGGAFTGWSTGSAHIAASAGLSFYLDDHLRRGLTLAVGAWAEDLLDLRPDGPGQVRGDTIGFAAGGELNLAIPFASFGHFEVGASIGYSERYGVAQNGMDLAVFPGFYIAPHVGVTFQLF